MYSNAAPSSTHLSGVGDHENVATMKQPPQAIQAEQALIGALLLDNSAWDRVADVVRETDFFRDDHRRIFLHTVLLIEQGQPADALTVSESLSRGHELSHIDVFAYLAQIMNDTPSAANIRGYAEIIHEKAILRKLISVASEIADAAFKPGGRKAKELLDLAESRVFDIADQGSRSQTGFQRLQPVLSQVVEHVQEMYERRDEGGLTGIPTGFIDLDEKTLGLQASDMIVLAGRPAMGKTSLALNIAENVAMDGGLPVAIFSMEMPASQLALRFLSSVARLDQSKVRSGQLSGDEWQQFSYALGRLNQAPIHIDETPGLNPIDLRARARRLARQCGKLGLIVIDYLQLMTGVRPGDNRAAELSEISRSIKSLARELHVPIIALSQLNRDLEKRPNKRPLMSDLRESGAIEQDADIIMFIYRDEVYNPDSAERGSAELIIGKHRNGPTGMVRLTFLGQSTRFTNYAHPQGAPYPPSGY
jgi:replicative DNA helicase